MKNIMLVLIAIAFSFTGCYTSFSPRDYEEERYGELSDGYYDSSYVAENIDSSDYYYPEDDYNVPSQGLTVINNYSSSAWDIFPPMFAASTIYGYGYSAGYYDPFYDPYYYPSYYPYSPYYGGNLYVYGDAYFGNSYYNGFNPAPVRYRNRSYFYANVRNSGGRGVVVKTRDRRRPITDSRDRSYNYAALKGFDLDRDLTVSKSTSRVRSSSSSKIRTASIIRDNGSKAKKVSDLERRRIKGTSRGNVAVRRHITKNDSRTQRVVKRRTLNKTKKYSSNTSSNRSKRVYSNNNSRSSSSSYYRPSRSSSSRNRTSVSGNTSRSRNSSYNSRSSSRSSVPRSSVRSHFGSSSRSSVSRSSNRSSSSRSSSHTSSRRRR